MKDCTAVSQILKNFYGSGPSDPHFDFTDPDQPTCPVVIIIKHNF
jgi:hypothetical protein